VLTSIVIEPIGLVRSRLRELRDAPCQAFEGAPPAILEIDPPNPIGLHRATVIDIHPPKSVHVDALEAIDGTPDS
jgi:tRNA (Thr-GGU) A37 N-methylase